jgi:hypothetical protein
MSDEVVWDWGMVLWVVIMGRAKISVVDGGKEKRWGEGVYVCVFLTVKYGVMYVCKRIIHL